MGTTSDDAIRIDRIIRSKRKTISLIVTQDADLVVRAPLRTSVAYINDLVIRKRAWILQKKAEMSSIPAYTGKQFVEGEEFLLLGNPYPLRISGSILPSVELGDCLVVRTPSAKAIPGMLAGWYRLQAQTFIVPRCEALARETGHAPSAIRISHASRRWGSCSTKGTVSFSWRLVLAPQEIIDYVIVHELAHLAHHNHSPRFWSRVRELMPDYRERKEWLRRHERVLCL